jgi:hypothetical protein
MDAASGPLSRWESFYVIVGSAGAALIGVQFVVITLIADIRHRVRPDAIRAFATPTVVHFAGAFLIAAIMSVPWASLVPAAAALVTCGLGGLGYGAVVIRRARRQTDYEPVWEDWLWYAILPCVAYGALAVAAPFLGARTTTAALVVGAAALGLLLIGIHNAWDSVTHLVITSAPPASATTAERRTSPEDATRR